MTVEKGYCKECEACRKPLPVGTSAYCSGCYPDSNGKALYSFICRKCVDKFDASESEYFDAPDYNSAFDGY